MLFGDFQGVLGLFQFYFILLRPRVWGILAVQHGVTQVRVEPVEERLQTLDRSLHVRNVSVLFLRFYWNRLKNMWKESY